MNKENFLQRIKQIKTLAEECLYELSGENLKPTEKSSMRAQMPEDIDFEKPIRAFVKQYARDLTGSAKFVLLLSWIVKGDETKEIPLKEIKERWNKMKGKFLLGFDFNRFYSAAAQESDWAESTRKGLYKLRPSWRKAFIKTNKK